MESVNEEDIDDSLYSRQRYVLGDHAMKKMAVSDVLLVGFGGLGIEIARNVTLAGVKSITVQDNRLCHISDLGVHCFIQEEDVTLGKTRLEAGITHLAELNPHVKVCGIREAFQKRDGSWSFLSAYKCIILTETDMATLLEVNSFCRIQDPPIAFIAGDICGLFGYGFCDFGENFEIYDANGEDQKELFICNITRDEPGVVTVFDARPHGFQTGDVVEFKEVSGMTELNGQRKEITVISPYQFTVDSLVGYSAYTGGGIVFDVKQTKLINFRSLELELFDPTLSMPDLAKFNAPGNIHICFLALAQLRSQSCEKYFTLEQFQQAIAEVNKSMRNPVELDDKIVHGFFLTRNGCFPPLCTVFGGFLAQEVLKSVSGKFSPLQQWLHLDCMEVISAEEIKDMPLVALGGDRYDLLRACVGQAACQRLAAANIFIVGCGAIGCELLKLVALLGIGTAGKVTITDNDLIEKSNLNRQFLFRPADVQKPKSVTAAQAAMRMNPSLNIQVLEHKVWEGTEQTIFTDEFFSSQDVILNALDNIEARVYVDQRCVDVQRPLLESGTTGAKGHSQVIIPHMTESYSSQRDPTDEDIPVCSLKSFPAKLDHCIIWARNKFQSTYDEKPKQFNRFWRENQGPGAVEQALSRGAMLQGSWIVSRLLKNRPLTFADCVRISRLKFEKYFNNSARELLHIYPINHLQDDGSLFWQLPRRPPQPIVFDSSKKQHMEFILSSSRLFARVNGISVKPEDLSVHSVAAILQRVNVPPFVPKAKRIVTDADTPVEEVPPVSGAVVMDDQEVVLASVRHCLLQPNANAYFRDMEPLEFEKDDDSNGHIDYIVATANLRAEVYGIAESDRYNIKRVAGKIIPAIATTTSTVAGLVMTELFKTLRKAALSDYKNCFLSLALPVLILSEPGQAKVIKIRDDVTFTLWDKISLQGHSSMTVHDFIKLAMERVGLEVDMLLQGSKIIYSTFLPAHRKKSSERLMTLIKLSEGKAFVDLTVCFRGVPDSISESIPPVRLYF